jgi:hypothetical protein
VNSTQAIRVAVVIERTERPNAWEDWQFRLLEVVPDEGAFGEAPRLLHDAGKITRWLYPGHTVALYADECKGYFLNLTSGRPVWFVSWLADGADPSMLNVSAVSLSYIEADRRMTAEEVVENLPLDPELCEWLRVFTNEHFRPDTGRKQRAMSFLSPQEREAQAMNPVVDAMAGQTAQPDHTTVNAVEVDPKLRNDALRKLFHGDPHFAQGDDLDVRVDEVAEIAASPLARQRKIQQARALGLLDDDLLDQAPDSEASDPAEPAR